MVLNRLRCIVFVDNEDFVKIYRGRTKFSITLTLIKCVTFLYDQESFLVILFCDIDVYWASLVLQLAINTAQFRFSVIRRQMTTTAIPMLIKIPGYRQFTGNLEPGSNSSVSAKRI